MTDLQQRRRMGRLTLPLLRRRRKDSKKEEIPSSSLVASATTTPLSSPECLSSTAQADAVAVSPDSSCATTDTDSSSLAISPTNSSSSNSSSDAMTPPCDQPMPNASNSSSRYTTPSKRLLDLRKRRVQDDRADQGSPISVITAATTATSNSSFLQQEGGEDDEERQEERDDVVLTPSDSQAPLASTFGRTDVKNMSEVCSLSDCCSTSSFPSTSAASLIITSAMTQHQPPPVDHWEFVSRWNHFSAKRLQLSRQRVTLEQGLFEFAELKRHRLQEATDWQPFVLLGEDDIAEEGDLDDMLGSSSTTSPGQAPQQQQYPTLASIRWEQVDFPDGQVYEGQVLVLLKRSLDTTASVTPTMSSSSSTTSAASATSSPPRRVAGMLFRHGNHNDQKKKNKAITPSARISTTTEWIRHGHGCNRWPDGQIYRGSWYLNSRHGRGTHSWPDGRTVTGGWYQGHLEGHIFFAWPDSSTYDGDAHSGKKHGRGIHTWDHGKRVYAGQYNNGTEHGFGTLTECREDGAVVICKYRGQFLAGKRHGYGVQLWQDKTYDGEWQHNVPSGNGKVTFHTTGACYTGEFLMGKYHGHGSILEAGSAYVGEWNDGLKHGVGHAYGQGTSYRGNFVRGKRNGYGRMDYADGSVYIGGWKRNKKSGYGIQFVKTVGMDPPTTSRSSGNDNSTAEEKEDAANNNNKVNDDNDDDQDQDSVVVTHCGLWKRDEPLAAVQTRSLDDHDVRITANIQRLLLPRDAESDLAALDESYEEPEDDTNWYELLDASFDECA